MTSPTSVCTGRDRTPAGSGNATPSMSCTSASSAAPDDRADAASAGSNSSIARSSAGNAAASAGSRGVSNPRTAVENAAIRNMPATVAERRRAASPARSKAANTSGAASTSACPAGVNTTPRPTRAVNGTPTCADNRLTCCETAEAVNPSSSAAPATEPVSEIAANARKACGSSILPPYGDEAPFPNTRQKGLLDARNLAGHPETMTTPSRPFGSVLTAMVTPMTPDGEVDHKAARDLVDHLLATGHDGIVVNGTTGESSTLSFDESVDMMRTVADQVGDRTHVVAGVGSNDTKHCIEMTKAAGESGVGGLLLVSPYYNKPTQRGLIAHCEAVAAATQLPIMLYDIPGRTGIPFASATLAELAKNPRIVAVKDAKGDQWAATKLMDQTDLAWYSGADEDNLAWLALGASGVISVVGHVAGSQYREMVDAVEAGDLDRARAVHRRLVPAVEAIMTTSQGAIMAKAALVELGVIPHASVRLPLVESTDDDLEILRAGLSAAGITG